MTTAGPSTWKGWARTTAVAAAALVMAGSLSGTANAVPGQTDSGSTIANVVVNSAIRLTALTPSFTLTGLPGETVSQNAIVTYKVETNNLAGYTVTVQARTATLAPTAPGNPDSIPIGALKVRETGTTPWLTLSNSSTVTVHTQATRSAMGGDSLSTDYQVTIPYVNEDTYTATLDYVATTL